MSTALTDELRRLALHMDLAVCAQAADEIERLNDVLTAWILFGYDFSEETDEKQAEMVVKTWRASLRALDEPTWANGRHEGDCTLQPFTCFRCLIDEGRRRAAHVSQILDRGGA